MSIKYKPGKEGEKPSNKVQWGKSIDPFSPIINNKTPENPAMKQTSPKDEHKPAKQFKNIVEKQQYWDSLVPKYGKYVKHRQVYLDALSQPLNILPPPYPMGIETHKSPVSGKLYSTPKQYNHNYKLPDNLKEDLNQIEQMSNEIQNSSIKHGGIINKDFIKHITNKSVEQEQNKRGLVESATWRFLPEVNSAYQEHMNDPANIEKHSWDQLLSHVPTDVSKPLFVASLFEEGLLSERKPTDTETTLEYPLSGILHLGLDRAGERSEEFIKKGYVKPDILSRASKVDWLNEKMEQVVSMDYYKIQDAIDNKIGFMKNAKSVLDKELSKTNYSISDAAKDFFTVVGYNYGEAGMLNMLRSYKEKGYLDGDKFFTETPSSYVQPYTYAMRRIQAAKMLEGEMPDIFSQNKDIPKYRDGGIVPKKATYTLKPLVHPNAGYIFSGPKSNQNK